MKVGFYTRLAWSNLRKNRRLYLPSILTGAGMNAVFYIILTLAADERLGDVKGGQYLTDLMPLGTMVVGLLSFILVLYTNSFIIKQRKREFGLYHILGMEKRHVGHILFWETAISGVMAVAAGLLGGILLYKLCVLIICRILKVDSILGIYYVSLSTVAPAGIYFLGLYLITCVINRVSIARMKPIEMLQSPNTGEKEPKTKVLMLLVGVLTLTAGYGISIATKQPLQALTLFFLAVVLVIIGTYCLFVSGSIAVLKLLKGRHRFYYQKNHMIAVSGMLYRMKQNAAGLASISIMATMVLVMMSSTVSLYAGIEDTLESRYTHQVYLNAGYYVGDDYQKIPHDQLFDMMEQTAEEQNLTITYHGEQRYLGCAFGYENGEMLLQRSNEFTPDVVQCFFMTQQDYESLTGEQLNLNGKEIAIHSLPSNQRRSVDGFKLKENEFTCTRQLDSFPISMEEYSIVDCFGIVLSSEELFQKIEQLQREAYGENASQMMEQLVVDFSDRKAMENHYEDYFDALRDKIQAVSEADENSNGGFGMSVNCYWDTKEYIYGLLGTLFFLGLILSFAFLFATALVIYYKQISEGYEDRNRFQIMRKVGMSEDETKDAIHTQIMLVFFLPLIVAAVHTAFALPILIRLMRVLLQSNVLLFLGCSAASFAVFALIYLVIYRMTAHTYYHIVS